MPLHLMRMPVRLILRAARQHDTRLGIRIGRAFVVRGGVKVFQAFKIIFGFLCFFFKRIHKSPLENVHIGGMPAAYIRL